MRRMSRVPTRPGTRSVRGAAPRGARSRTSAGPRPERLVAERAAGPCLEGPQEPQFLGGGVASDGPLAALSLVTVVLAGSSGLACAALVISLVMSLVALRNSFMALPTAPPSSGRRPGPKMIKTTTRRRTMYAQWIPNTSRPIIGLGSSGQDQTRVKKP